MIRERETDGKEREWEGEREREWVREGGMEGEGGKREGGRTKRQRERRCKIKIERGKRERIKKND